MVAIMTREAGAPWLAEQLAAAGTRVIAAPTALELGIVLESRSPAAVGIARRILRDARVDVVGFDESLFERAIDGWRRFGKGRHPAALNFGDCCSFALAEERGWPLLCVGQDFARTDLPVLTPPG
jgi:ribonuclease VapC